MSLHILDNKLWFPPQKEALKDGLLAIGGDLTTERLLMAYRNGIFPWFEDTIPLWWCPDPRFVLMPQELYVSKSMQQVIKKNIFRFTVNTAFDAVIRNCKTTYRKNQHGTWITDDVEAAYMQLHQLGYAHSAEAWIDNKLVGGLYGVRIGKMYFGESMFSLVSNASKFAFIQYIRQLMAEADLKMIDCQVYTEHLETLGAKMIRRSLFLDRLERFLNE